MSNITYTGSPECDLGLSQNSTGGSLKFWVTSKCAEEGTRFHVVEFSTSNPDGNGKRSDIWRTNKGDQNEHKLLPETKLVVVYKNGEEILNCGINQQKKCLISVDTVKVPEPAPPTVTAPPIVEAAVVAASEAPKAKPVRKRTTTPRAKKVPVTT